VSYFNQSDLDRAIADYNEAIRLRVQSALLYNRRGVAFVNRGDLQGVIADYTEAIRVGPTLAQA
jgi:tetratricopeptide (TPR) repeat protein